VPRSAERPPVLCRSAPDLRARRHIAPPDGRFAWNAFDHRTAARRDDVHQNEPEERMARGSSMSPISNSKPSTTACATSRTPLTVGNTCSSHVVESAPTISRASGDADVLDVLEYQAAMAPAAYLLEPVRVAAALSRSGSLVRGAWWQTFALRARVHRGGDRSRRLPQSALRLGSDRRDRQLVGPPCDAGWLCRPVRRQSHRVVRSCRRWR
jgi:hypothetical protein